MNQRTRSVSQPMTKIKTPFFPKQAATKSDEASLTFKGHSPDHSVEVLEDLDYTIFEIDPRIQREERPGEINKIINNFNPDALSVFTISVREVDMPDGSTATKWFLVDGQQRRAALLRLKWD